ncbi:MAG TPA: SIS domain-containing protein, partial [Dehalococcoidia bacterium]|nr:SIS domain-containing protein [Dehalococcoidia bacterium]
MLGDKVTGIPNHELSNFMLKEIHEQPSVLVDIIEGRLSRDSNKLELLELNLSDQQLKSFETVLFIGMGTSLHAGMVGKLWFERIAAIKAESDNSSEFKDRNPILNKKTLAISISQSGETGDTLSAMKTAKESGATVLNIGNVEGSP